MSQRPPHLFPAAASLLLTSGYTVLAIVTPGFAAAVALIYVASLLLSVVIT